MTSIDGSVIRASAPARLDFAGGWTDVAPFATERRGVVVNAAIELRAEAELRVGGDRYRLEAVDLGQVFEADRGAALEPGGQLDLLKAAVRMHGLPPCRLTTRSAAPAGSGLGSSGAMDVALIAACTRAVGRPLLPPAIADRAWELESVEAGLPGGRQDQYAAALGGFHRLEFSASGVGVHRLAIGPAFADWLARHVVVCYTGQSRVSSRTIERVMTRFVQRDAGVVAALEGLAEAGARMAEALEAGDERAVGSLLSANWRLQQRLDSGIRTPEMAGLEQVMADCGSLGGKAAGAGAGGTMFFVIGGDPARAARAAAEQGSTVLPLQWAWEGVRVW